jgi:hypothetical protein
VKLPEHHVDEDEEACVVGKGVYISASVDILPASEWICFSVSEKQLQVNEGW